MNKQELRQWMDAEKKRHTTEQLLDWSVSIQKQIEEWEVFRQSRVIMLYYSLPCEVQTHQMLQEWAKQKTCLLPHVYENQLVIKKYEGENSLRKGSLGIPEPTGEIFAAEKTIDLILVPGVAFDKAGNRLGRGKGYYDRFLRERSAPTAGICFDFQLTDHVPTDKHDVPMDYVITPSSQYRR